jgi:hypothetical protein
MNPALKNAVEWALIALLVAGVCLGLLGVANGGEEEISAVKATMLSLGIAGGCLAHLVFMAQCLKLSGRRMMPWLLLLILFMPVASMVLLALLFSGSQSRQAG